MQLRQHVAAEDLHPLRLVAADIVEVDLRDAEVEEPLDLGAVDVGVGRDHHPAVEVRCPHECGHLLEVMR